MNKNQRNLISLGLLLPSSRLCSFPSPDYHSASLKITSSSSSETRNSRTPSLERRQTCAVAWQCREVTRTDLLVEELEFDDETDEVENTAKNKVEEVLPANSAGTAVGD